MTISSTTVAVDLAYKSYADIGVAVLHESPSGIEVTFPKRSSWTSGTDYWIVYWFAISLVAAFAVKPLLKVNI